MAAKEQMTSYRQIRAHYNDEHVTVYQAYSVSIAKPNTMIAGTRLLLLCAGAG